MNTEHLLRKLGKLSALIATVLFVASGSAYAQTAPAPSPTPDCERTVKADVVALDQVIVYNRLGAINPSGMIYALKQDVVPTNASQGLTPGNVQLRADKRPRPLTLRLNAGDCLQINFTNLLSPTPVDNDQPATRTAGVHVMGMELVGSIASDASNVGQNQSSIVAPGGSATYTYYATREGNNFMYSPSSMTGGEGNGGSVAMGLFGSVNVEPRGAEWYRAQVTAAELALATKKNADGTAKKTASGQPMVDYNAVYPQGHTRAGQPILKITDSNLKIVHGDLNAIITGPNQGRFPAGTYRPNATSPDRDQPFREFTVIYHDEVKAVQAFEEFRDPVLSHTLYSVKDGFAINYGIAGVGAEILANRKGVGPMANCVECKYEDFFLSSWAIGDPAQLVDIPANATDAQGNLITGAKATKVLYPGDPSNVHHSYMGDHVKMRVSHAGPKEHHIHHLHAHQWLQTPDDDNSTYLDSQAIGPGSSFTSEISHGGSGNRNQTVGDSIFHCHFYPHFAQGMWELWRVHDVFEAGTQLDGDGRPSLGSRALPDGEIAVGSPIPAIVPLPTKAMAPMPTDAIPGYPFFVPGVAGHRAPQPPMDLVDDGGLPRHVITAGTAHSVETRLDFSKELLTAVAQEVPQNGTSTELTAMNYHAQRNHSSFTPEGMPANFVLNGLPAKPGAPFADPCINDAGAATGTPRTYKGAAIQLDLKFNKAGWHFPQSRILSLWEDVAPTLAGTRAPEPFFFRANTGDCITFYHTNLTPNVYEQDDFQIRTPTDIMGQHIHLVKFDVTSSDGSGNGFNYEDGTFAPEEVIERIHAINAAGGMLKTDGTQTALEPKEHPFFATLGAQTTVQRWYADNTLNNNGVDRTLRTVFSHDHFGPSTHQQAGLYAGLVMEPAGSTWRNPETGQMLGQGRSDGGPTSWRADIITTDSTKSYREFLLEFADYALAYEAGAGVDSAGNAIADPLHAINPPIKKEVGLPYIVERGMECPGGVPAPCPEAVSAADPGTMTLNYRNEPIPLRVRDPQTNTQAAGLAGDLSHVYRSNITRADAAFNSQPNFYPALTGGILPGDPYTPLMRVYENDRVQIRVLVGAHEEGHNFSINDHKWKHQPGTPDDPTFLNNSGNRASQMMGISEHFEFFVGKMNAVNGKELEFADYLYQPSSSVDGQWNGVWGLLRAYNGNLGLQPDLLPLPYNLKGRAKKTQNWKEIAEVCPVAAPVRNMSVTAVSAAALPQGKLIYNNREGNGGQLNDPTAIMYFRTSDIDTNGKVKAGVPIEPLVLRANAGDCLNVTLINRLPAVLADVPGYNTMPNLIDHFNANQVKPSNHVGLHPQLVWYDVTKSDGMNVGHNPVQTVAPGQSITYKWYAGDSDVDGIKKDIRVLTPAEYGATNLIPSDPIKHSNKGAIGGLIIEPFGSTWVEDAASRAQATVTKPDGTSFREFVVHLQNDVNLLYADGTPVRTIAGEEDNEDSGHKAINYRSEPFWKRMGYAPESPLNGGDDDGDGDSNHTPTRAVDFTNVLSNSQVGGDPVTPVFTAKAGQQVRFRLLQAGGHARHNVFQVHGHFWQEEPYKDDSQTIGNNPLSEVKGAQYGVGPTSHFDIVPTNGAGGSFRVPGDYLYRTSQSFQFDAGLWGIFRVTQ